MRKRGGWGAVVVAVAFAVVGCAHHEISAPLMVKSSVPAASGTVTLSNRDQPNKTLDVRVQNLAQPQNLPADAVASSQPGVAQAYVVWVQPPGGRPDNVGVLTIGSDLSGDLKTTTIYDKFQIFVTAEPSTTPIQPTGPHLLEATISP